MKRIPDSIKMEIIAKISTDMTQREIAKELKVSDGYVAKVVKEVNHTSVNSAGRNPILSDTTKRHSILKFKMGGYATATAASRAIVPIIKAKISPETVRNVLREANFNSKRKPKALPLNAQRKKARPQFARKYKDWAVLLYFDICIYSEGQNCPNVLQFCTFAYVARSFLLRLK
ncbi:hypothetical protein G6F68_015486 [Rhizopus microsporus]|nr:hypothetical protein G6F68_015486 [Rhizopus microsporus]